MGHRLTKHQKNVWEQIKPHLSNKDYKTELTFDDEYSVYRLSDIGNHNIIIPPKEEVIYHFIGNSGDVIIEHFTINESNINELINLFLSE